MNNTWLENRIIKRIKNFLLPEATPSDSGKTVVVDNNGQWGLGSAGSNVKRFIGDIHQSYSSYDSSSGYATLVYTLLDEDDNPVNWDDIADLSFFEVIADIPIIDYDNGNIIYNTSLCEIHDHTIIKTDDGLIYTNLQRERPFDLYDERYFFRYSLIEQRENTDPDLYYIIEFTVDIK